MMREFDAGAVGVFEVGVTNANEEVGGTCRLESESVCLYTSLELDTERVAQIEVRDAAGEVVVTHGAEDGEIVRLQIGKLERGGRVEREIRLLDANGELVDDAVAYTECQL